MSNCYKLTIYHSEVWYLTRMKKIFPRQIGPLMIAEPPQSLGFVCLFTKQTESIVKPLIIGKFLMVFTLVFV